MNKINYSVLSEVLAKHNASFELCAELANELKKDNLHFDGERFLANCAYPSVDYLYPA